MLDNNSNMLIDFLSSLKTEIPKRIELHNDLKAEQKVNGKAKDKNNIIKNANNKVLVEVLSPEIKNNEKAKRVHKYILLLLLTIFLVAQFLSVYNMSTKIIDYSITNNSKHDVIKILLTFISAYITSVVVELIAILRYIVKHVFDASITELVKIFKDKEEYEK